jgi:oxygen-independent coproporphyrinogen-3 oxidase
MADYARACRMEVRRAVDDGMPCATSVFFGGGTPSLLPGDELVVVLEAIPRVPGAEVTVECNPENVTEPLLDRYHAAGVTRLSFGVQSMVPHVLASLGRSHDPSAVTRAITLARDAGFRSFNLDLIYGAVGESGDDWRRTLEAALMLDPPHVSAYALTVEAGTPLAADPARHPDDDVQATRYLAADAALDAAGLVNYEISNWARRGHECRHNQLYWDQGDYRGIGCAAHSHASGRRWWNVRTPERYIALVSSGRSAVAAGEVLDAQTRGAEAVQLALRTRRGAALRGLDQDAVEMLASRGLLRSVEGRVVLTPSGRLLASEVAARLT